MLSQRAGYQVKMFYGSIENLMPEKHFLRDLEKAIDFSFIYEKVAHLYSNKGAPSVDPVIIIKMLLIGYFYGIESERQLENECNYNITYKWFLGLELEDKVPDHSTISQLRRRKFSDSSIFQDIFDVIVRKCIEEGLVDGKLLLTDSTHIKANANRHKYETVSVTQTPSEYMKRLDQEAYEQGLIPEPTSYVKKKPKEVDISTSDPDSGMLNRPGKPKEFCYLDHQTTDAKSGIITDVYVTSGAANDSTPHSARIQAQIEKFGFETEAVCADAGYDSSEIRHDMYERGIKTYIPARRKPTEKNNYQEGFEPDKFTYDADNNCYTCPNGKTLKFSCYNKKDRNKIYKASLKDCRNCPYREKCIGQSKRGRAITRLMHEESRDEQLKNNNTPEYYEALRLRQIWCEGNFAQQKAHHNLQKTYKRGINKLREQCLLSACALNLKRLVKASLFCDYFFHFPLFLGFFLTEYTKKDRFVNSPHRRPAPPKTPYHERMME